MTTAVIERAKTPPREDLLRDAPFAMRAADPETPNDGRTLDGYGAVFGRVTIIDSWEGRFKEDIARGSMKKSFDENPPRIQFDHGRHPLIGSIPIAKLTFAREEKDPDLAPDWGAHIVGRISDNWMMWPIRDAIAEGNINGMSFRFSVVREEWRYPDGKLIKDDEELFAELMKSWNPDYPESDLLTRSLRELKVPEMGPVAWPAYEATSVGVRSKVTIDLGKLGDPEQKKILARVIYAADAAERTDEDSKSVSKHDSSTGGSDSPEPTDDRSAGDHEPGASDTPQPTDDESAGEHESSSQVSPDFRERLKARAKFQEQYLPLIVKGGSRYGA
jgi:phage head maturation protease